MDLLSLVTLWLDNVYQIKTKVVQDTALWNGTETTNIATACWQDTAASVTGWMEKVDVELCINVSSSGNVIYHLYSILFFETVSKSPEIYFLKKCIYWWYISKLNWMVFLIA